MYQHDFQPGESWHVSARQKPDYSAYLHRIGIAGQVDKPSLSALKMLQRHHLLHIPFENLDIRYGSKIDLHTENFFKKIVLHNRGGYCYELNGLFYWLLQKSGFRVRMISARVCTTKGIIGAEFDHLALVITLNGREYLADVGFGDFSCYPLLIKPGVEQKDPNGLFMIREHAHGFVALKKHGSVWKQQYVFSTSTRELADFSLMNHFHQTSAASHFTQRTVCSLMTKTGRITLTDNRLLTTTHGKKSQHVFHTVHEFNDLLEKHFGFRMDA